MIKNQVTLQVRNNNGLSTDEMLKHCPSIFACQPHESRSSKYLYISTLEILEKMKREGFYPVKAQQSRSRIEGKSEFTKHMIRFRQEDHLGFNVDEEVQEIGLINSHDGTSGYELYNGIYRTVCTNGLVTCVQDLDNYKVLHKGNIQDNIIDIAYNIINEGKEAIQIIGEMKKIELTKPEQLLLSEYSLKAKYGFEESEEKSKNIEEKLKEIPFTPEKFLKIRRMEDKKPDLYTTYNVIQENHIKGGISVRDKAGKKHTSRATNSIDNDIKINKLLWLFSKEMLKLKTN